VIAAGNGMAHSHSRQDEVQVSLGEGAAVIRKHGRSRPIIAGVLGIESDADGMVQQVWLDRLVHAPGEEWDGAWAVSGAVSSVLTRRRTEA
jgi:hypothetical protein